jgi:2-aminoadipate transaminase
MDYDRFYSERTRKLKASEIRELLKLTQRSDIISFAGGLPNPLTFPVEEIREATDRVLKGDPELALQYGPTEGYTPLRDEVARHLNKDDFDVARENIVITNGSQQGLDLLGRVFLNAGDRIIVGNPTYLGALSAFSTYKCEFVTTDEDEDGMKMDVLEETLEHCRAEGRPAKLVYTVPTFQNPAGTVLSAPRRRRLLDLAHEYDLIVVEDDPYGKLRYTGDHIPTLYAMDKEERVVYLGTFSKILVPGFRLAWTAAPEPIMRRMVISKQATDLCTNSFTQFIAADLMANDLIDRHLPKIIQLYARKRKIMLDTMAETMPREHVHWTDSEGGLFTWAQLPREVNTVDLLQKAIERKVAYVPGHAFFVRPEDGTHTMRLNFSHPADELVETGVRRLAEVITERIEAKVTT